MAKEFLPLFLDFNETTQDLNDEQCGRLIRALVDYANGKERDIDGVELIAFRFLKGSIDRNEKLSAIRAEAGAKGGRPKSKEKQTKANESKQKQNDINNNNNKDINNESNKNNSFASDDEMVRISEEQNRVLDAAEDAGFLRSNTVRAKLIDLYSIHGMDKMLNAISSCVNHGVIKLAYLEACLKGEPKKAKTVKLLAQDYDQRDYSGEQDAAMERMMRWSKEA